MLLTLGGFSVRSDQLNYAELDVWFSSNEDLDFDAIVIGAGISGLYLLYRLREAGLNGPGL